MHEPQNLERGPAEQVTRREMAEGLLDPWKEPISAGDACWSGLWVVCVANKNIGSFEKVGVSKVSHRVHMAV